MNLKRSNILLLIVWLPVIFCYCFTSITIGLFVPHRTLQQNEAYDVFLIAGQSNVYYGTGYDSIKDKKDPRIFQLGRREPNDLKIIEAAEPLEHFNPKSDRIGFGMTFAKEYLNYFHDSRKVLLVPCGMDNSGFNGDGWNKGNFLYDNTVSRINYVLKNNPKSRLVAILWAQGERDVGYQAYQRSLDSLIIHFRKEIIGATDVPFILGGMVPYWTEKNRMRQKQQKIIKNTVKRISNVEYVDPYVPFRITKPDNATDFIHYDADGQREMGKRYFAAFKKLMKYP